MSDHDAHAWSRLAAEAEDLATHIRELPVQPDVTPAEVRQYLEREYRFDRPRPLAELVGEAAGMLREWTVHITHPRYFGLFNPSVREAGALADALVGIYNPQLAAWSHAPAANEIERHTLRALAQLIGFEGDVHATFTSGGAEANVSALLTAIAHRAPEALEDGLGAVERRPLVYVSEQSHHSFLKGVRMAGLGTSALRILPTTDRLTLDVGAFRRQAAADLAGGHQPLMLVATAGTTSAGAIDPLKDLADAAAEVGCWYHVDAAWGALAALSPRLRPVLAGIERADSVTWDAHKGLSVPMGAGMFFCRHPEAVQRAFGVATAYMPGRSEDAEDPYATTMQWSRRAIGMKVFLSLAELGLDGYAALVEHQAAMGDALRERLVATSWEVVNETPLPLVCFTHADVRSGRLTTADVLASIHARRRVWISETVLRGERVLRACITSFRTEPGDLDVVIEELEHARRSHAVA
jgi:glutamate/tyrosine decarboxylase-like PLP-dependent enzyme